MTSSCNAVLQNCKSRLGDYDEIEIDVWLRNKNMANRHECPCRIGKSHPRGRNFIQGRGLPRPWLKFRSRRWDFPILHGLVLDDLFFYLLSSNRSKLQDQTIIRF